MRTISISNNNLNKLIDSINGACVGLAKVLEKPNYSKDEYIQAINKLGTRVNDFFKVIKVDHDNTMKSYTISMLETRTMRITKDKETKTETVKVLSGSGFRKWFKTELMAKYAIDFKTTNDKNNAKSPSKKELEAKIKELEAKLAAK